jgi:hypothetical protein
MINIEIDATKFIPKRDIKDTIIFNHSPHISDIEKARDNDQIVICNNPTDYTLGLIEGLPDELKMYIVLYNYQLIDSEFKAFMLKRLETEDNLRWYRMGY